ncbi:MAG: hypothetical protein GY853_03755 [PVC group bacterium]|nr:hypothetical protein [PVC group bacterium]
MKKKNNIVNRKKINIMVVFFVICFLFSLWTISYEPWTSLSFAQEEVKEEEIKQVFVYADKDSEKNSFSPSEWIADGEDLSFDGGWEKDPQQGKTCIKIDYKAAGNFGWAGIYWVNPKGNWGNQKGGYDLRFAKKLTFWVRGEKGGEYIAGFKFGGLKGVFPDSDNHGIGPITLTEQWQELSIDISQRNMKYISAGFSFAITKAHNRNGCTFYIDNIKYE